MPQNAQCPGGGAPSERRAATDAARSVAGRESSGDKGDKLARSDEWLGKQGSHNIVDELSKLRLAWIATVTRGATLARKPGDKLAWADEGDMMSALVREAEWRLRGLTNVTHAVSQVT